MAPSRPASKGAGRRSWLDRHRSPHFTATFNGLNLDDKVHRAYEFATMESIASRGLVVVTGSSRGIGAATALKLAHAGYAICVNFHRRDAEANRVVQEIRNSGGVAFSVQADVGVEQDVQRLFQVVDRHEQPLVGLVNNAGILETQARISEIDVARLERVFRTNVFGTFLCTQAAYARMARRNGGSGGSLVNVSSAAARHGSAFEYVDYAAAKGAVDSFTLGAAKEFAADGIRVNAVRPGLIETDIHADGGEPGRVSRLAATVPLGRGGTADEVANTIAWLLGDEASYVTGVLLDVTGGR